MTVWDNKLDGVKDIDKIRHLDYRAANILYYSNELYKIAFEYHWLIAGLLKDAGLENPYEPKNSDEIVKEYEEFEAWKLARALSPEGVML
jgi:hypothetical protein